MENRIIFVVDCPEWANQELLEATLDTIPKGHDVYVIDKLGISKEYPKLDSISSLDVVDFDYFVYLLAGDELLPHYMPTLDSMIREYPKLSVAIPLCHKVMDGKLRGLMNVFLWTPLFGDESDEGRLGGEKLLKSLEELPATVSNFCFSGGAVKKSTMKPVGALRDIKHPFLEWANRASTFGFEVRVMPKAVAMHLYRVSGSDNLAEVKQWVKSLSDKETII